MGELAEDSETCTAGFCCRKTRNDNFKDNLSASSPCCVLHSLLHCFFQQPFRILVFFIYAHVIGELISAMLGMRRRICIVVSNLLLHPLVKYVLEAIIPSLALSTGPTEPFSSFLFEAPYQFNSFLHLIANSNSQLRSVNSNVTYDDYYLRYLKDCIRASCLRGLLRTSQHCPWRDTVDSIKCRRPPLRNTYVPSPLLDT